MKEPVEWFFQFVTDKIIEIGMRETNRYGRENVDNGWVNVTKPELYVYIALQITMEILVLPSVEMYWEKDAWGGVVLFNFSNRYSFHPPEVFDSASVDKFCIFGCKASNFVGKIPFIGQCTQ